jgi:threonine/homoserine/homoserine lactone efflux protein
MTLTTWLVYLAAVFILTVTPGPSVLLCITNGIKHGTYRAAFSAAGSITAVVGIMLLSAIGLGAALAASEFVFAVIKWLGAAYLLYLGIRLLLSKGQDGFAVNVNTQNQPKTRRALYVEGFLVGASNPKALIFFSALFPQFINPNAPQIPQFAILCATFVVFETFWLLTYASFASRIAPWLQRHGRQLIFDRACGATFVGAGLLLLASKRSGSA